MAGQDNAGQGETAVPLSQKCFLGLSTAGSNMLSAIVGSAVLSYYLDFLHLAPRSIGSIYLLYGIWNALNDPLFGVWSDRRKAAPGKGKRLFFLKLAIPFFAIGYALFWIPSPGWSQTALFVSLFAALFVFDTAFTMYVLNQNAIQAAMTSDTNERASLSLWCTLISVLPVAASRFLPSYLLTGSRPRGLIVASFLAIAAIGIAAMIAATARIKERPAAGEGEDHPLALWPSLKATFSSASFIFFVIYSFAMGGVALASASILIPYLKYAFRLEGTAAMLPVLIGGVAQVAMYPLIYRVNRGLGLRKTLFLGIALAIVGYAGMFFARGVASMIAFYSLTQIGAGCHWLLFNAIIGDIADEDELKTGQRREGAFFGINALIVAPAQSIIFALFTWIIEAFGYTAAFGGNSAPDPALAARAAEGIRIGSAAVPCLFLLVGIVALYFYPLKGERYAAMKAAVARLRAAERPSAAEGGEH
jgi:GPH family glycoside/pentoside/hexuronide:cation symporter